MDYEITCIVTQSSQAAIQMRTFGGPAGYFTTEEIIQMIRMGVSFWLKGDGARRELCISGRVLDGEFLTTSPDGSEINWLSTLPSCRADDTAARPYDELVRISRDKAGRPSSRQETTHIAFEDDRRETSA